MTNIGDTRKFGGKKFYLEAEYNNMELARYTATVARQAGQNARIVKVGQQHRYGAKGRATTTPRRYQVWVR